MKAPLIWPSLLIEVLQRPLRGLIRTSGDTVNKKRHKNFIPRELSQSKNSSVRLHTLTIEKSGFIPSTQRLRDMCANRTAQHGTSKKTTDPILYSGTNPNYKTVYIGNACAKLWWEQQLRHLKSLDWFWNAGSQNHTCPKLIVTKAKSILA